MHQLIAIFSSPWVPARYGKAPYFWLLSFTIMGWKYLYVTPGLQEISLLAISILAFLLIYFYSFWQTGWKNLACITVICAMGIAWAPYNYGGSTFCIFAATMCSRMTDTRQAYLGLLTIGLVVALSSFIFKFEATFWIPAIIFSIPSGVGAIIGERLTRSNESLLKKQEEVEYLAALAERERIARDLHDLLGHTLSVITLKAELAGKLLERNPDACKKEIHDIEHTARQALAEVRAAVIGYRATGLGHELQSAKNALDAAQVSLVTDIQAINIPAATENVLALAVREAVTNIIRHAEASICHIKLSILDQYVRLTITDNGVAGQKLSINKGSGLNGMSERVRALGGSVQVLIKPDTPGLHLELSLPLKEEK
ncbi:sensor histidine kinase [Undibacterium pigrum]|uniref:Two-component system sensor histidine kinase DesK n=1 Tax=Undibacterium pigrum TaxID=401470 RepID=A0A318J643_9BURK|nr:sensor histidine kinase [Undibacterium pigrum]PXX43329.1 two-component system sensor histidine kinase DesK [Undibacterium pigrum]